MSGRVALCVRRWETVTNVARAWAGLDNGQRSRCFQSFDLDVRFAAVLRNRHPERALDFDASIDVVDPCIQPVSTVGAECDQPDVRRRLLVKPGMTGLWQVSGRSDLPWEESVRLDLRYVEDWSLALDALILWKTLRAVFGGEGAY